MADFLQNCCFVHEPYKVRHEQSRLCTANPKIRSDAFSQYLKCWTENLALTFCQVRFGGFLKKYSNKHKMDYERLFILRLFKVDIVCRFGIC